jgi:hypothetical protein
MSQIALPELPGSLQHIDVTQGQYRDQIGAVAQLCRQVGGNADLAQEVLTSKYTLYVSPDTGRDDFVPGEANFTTGLTRQQASCGYSIYAHSGRSSVPCWRRPASRWSPAPITTSSTGW